jgi:hypothetical protein
MKSLSVAAPTISFLQGLSVRLQVNQSSVK